MTSQQRHDFGDQEQQQQCNKKKNNNQNNNQPFYKDNFLLKMMVPFTLHFYWQCKKQIRLNKKKRKKHIKKIVEKIL